VFENCLFLYYLLAGVSQTKGSNHKNQGTKSRNTHTGIRTPACAHVRLCFTYKQLARSTTEW